MKQDQLAELVGTDQPTISKWERGVVRPSIENLILIEERTGRPRGFIFVAAGLVDLPLDTRGRAAAAAEDQPVRQREMAPPPIGGGAETFLTLR